ncbi:uncharacterized protein [Coffea arabica]|uniref:Chromo domain-containing protein n=1 Tax=Coffea arabica TaxID=13443 RepID=A0ABM4VZC7_COFAR
MDWLARYNVQLNCRTKIVELCILGEATLKLDVRGKLVSSALILGILVRKLLSKEVQGYLAFLINTPSDKVNLEDMPVVKDFPDVFPEELESLPPEREITFKIDVTPRVARISKTPHRMAPMELKELKLQLQDLLERGFIKESDSQWGGPVKAEHQKLSELLQPLEILEWKWENITMNFVSGLPRTQRDHDAIWVIVDRLIKSAHFLPINMKYPLEKLAKLYLDEIIRLHGIPYHLDPSHILQPESIDIDEVLTYEEKPVKLLDRKVKELRNKQIPLVKVLWKNYGLEEATWEVEKSIREMYPDLFINQGKFRG